MRGMGGDGTGKLEEGMGGADGDDIFRPPAGQFPPLPDRVLLVRMGGGAYFVAGPASQRRR
jgi:hypothetical protein